jgi:hypothetical protein
MSVDVGADGLGRHCAIVRFVPFIIEDVARLPGATCYVHVCVKVCNLLGAAIYRLRLTSQT